MDKPKWIKIVYNLIVIATLVLIGYYTYLAYYKKDQFTIDHYHVIIINSIATILSVLAIIIINNFSIIKIPLYLELLFIIFIISNFIFGEMIGLFRTTTWFDGAVHALGGCVLTVSAIFLFQVLESKSKIRLSSQPFLFIILAFALASTIGVLWELIEYTTDGLIGSNMQRFLSLIDGKPLIGRAALNDTMNDFILNSLGALIICIPSYILLDNKRLKNLNI